MTNTTKKHTNEGHEGKVPMGRSIGFVFILALLAGGFVTFLAVAGRTQGIVEQRREKWKAEQAKTQKPVETKSDAMH